MTQSTTYDAIVVGAGSLGVPTAYYLAKAGLKVLVLDSVSSVGQGSNKRAIGGIRATHSDPAKIRLCLRSIEIFSTFRETFGEDIEWDQCGYSFVAYTPREEKTLNDLLAKQKNYGLNIDWYSPDDLLKIVPDLNPRGLLGGTFSPGDGSASPLLTNHAYYTLAVTAGVTFKFNEPVSGMKLQNGRIQAVKTPQGEYAAAIVVNTAGPNAAAVGKLAGVDLPVRPDSHEAAITEPVARFLGPMIVDIRPAAGSSNYYFYQHITGQIIFCITPSPNAWGENVDETSSFLPMVSRRMLEIMPRLANIRVRRTWRGLYPMTPDGFPIVGWSAEVENLLLGVGLCGQGFMLGPSTGELLTRLATGSLLLEDKETLSYLSPSRKFEGQELLK
ncbi:MAG TPA: FAD-binding oxidoreductase [Anaerolineaceae bacterium]|nr:FAD-binding oxidoreductase [Anaerolineaceae bacterium]